VAAALGKTSFPLPTHFGATAAESVLPAELLAALPAGATIAGSQRGLRVVLSPHESGRLILDGDRVLMSGQLATLGNFRPPEPSPIELERADLARFADYGLLRWDGPPGTYKFTAEVALRKKPVAFRIEQGDEFIVAWSAIGRKSQRLSWPVRLCKPTTRPGLARCCRVDALTGEELPWRFDEWGGLWAAYVGRDIWWLESESLSDRTVLRETSSRTVRGGRMDLEFAWEIPHDERSLQVKLRVGFEGAVEMPPLACGWPPGWCATVEANRPLQAILVDSAGSPRMRISWSQDETTTPAILAGPWWSLAPGEYYFHFEPLPR